MNDEIRKKRNEYMKKYRKEHLNKIKEYQKRYWAEHGEEINAKRRNRKAYRYRCNKAIEYIENKIEYLNEQKRLITNILTPQNGYLKTDIEIEISKYQELLNILKGEEK